jgi:ABC-2 type transport system permease protein
LAPVHQLLLMPIFDQGYQHWSGALAGHTWRWLPITRHGIRVGLREGKPGRQLRLLILLAWMPALALATVLCLWGLAERGSELITFLKPLLQFLGPAALAEPREYRIEVWTLAYHYFLAGELTFSMILVLMVGPDLISQDLRYNALPLYFSRPLRRIDYFCGKLGVIVAFLGMVIVLPSIVAYVLGLLFSLDITILRDTFRVLVASVVYGLVIALSTGMLVLALSSLSRNSRYISLMWIAVWIGTSIMSGVLGSVDEHQQRQQQRAHQQARFGGPPGFNMPMPGGEAADMAEQIRESKSGWYPIASYTANLSRVGQALLGVDAAVERLASVQPPQSRYFFLSRFMGPQYPWYWSAGVLIALFVLSACILNLRVRSLDRLK